MPGKGQPSILMVWDHLKFLKSIVSQVKDEPKFYFLHDLKSTYQYLQDHEIQTKTIAGLATQSVWLNLTTYEHNIERLIDVKSAWYSATKLVLSSSCDAGSIKAVKPALMRYEKLLRSAGCKSIVYPSVTAPIIKSGHSVSKGLREMRKSNQMTDIGT